MKITYKLNFNRMIINCDVILVNRAFSSTFNLPSSSSAFDYSIVIDKDYYYYYINYVIQRNYIDELKI